MAQQPKKSAIVLLSGGLDSATVLAIAREQGFACHALTFNYGQRHAVELDAAARVAQVLGACEQHVVDVDLRWIGASALTADLPVPKDRSPTDENEIPITYVPARNALFLCYGLAWAEAIGATDLFAGMNALDYSGYPDCRPEFVAAFEQMARLATRAGVLGARFTVHTPLMHMTKAEIVREGTRLGIDYRLTHSCYDPNEQGQACGHCDACVLRHKGFIESGITDPTNYAG